MVKIAVTLLAVIFFVGCEWPSVKTQAKAKKNIESILSLKNGMTEDEVFAAMGKPRKKKSYSLDDRTIEFWFYLTRGLSLDDRKFRDADYTPLAFEKGELIGWGRRLYERTLMYQKKLKTE